MIKTNKGIVFFDLDGTLIDGESEFRFFLFLLKQKKIRFKQFISATYFLLRWFLTYKLHVFIKNKSYLNGLEKTEIHQLAKGFVTQHILKKIRPSIKALVDQHLKQGDRIILLTGTHDFLGKVVADYLGIKEVYGTKCVYKNGKFTNAPPKQHPFSINKLTIAEKVCKKSKANIKDAIAYGNSINDRYILGAVGKPIAVTPDRKLRKLAKTKGWEIL